MFLFWVVILHVVTYDWQLYWPLFSDCKLYGETVLSVKIQS